MASPAQPGGFYSTPAFKLYQRGLTPQTIKRFKGINTWALLTAISPTTGLTPDWAQNCLNVIVDSNGALWKFRLPSTLSVPISGKTTGPDWFFDFQQANGNRQVVANFGTSLYYYSADLSVATLIETSSDDGDPWNAVELSNIMYMTNGQRMAKWTGANLWQMGIYPPGQALLGISIVVTGNFTRVGTTVTYTDGGIKVLPGYPSIGDLINVQAAPFPDMLGTFVVTSADDIAGTITWTQAGLAESGNGGELFLQSFSDTYPIPAGQAVRKNGDVTLSGLSLDVQYIVGNYITVAGVTDASFDGTYIVTAVTATSVSYFQPNTPDSTSGGGTVAFPLSPTFGYLWGVSFGNTVTGGESSLSLVTPNISPLDGAREFIIQVVRPNDPQVNIAYLYRTLDGGGIFYLDQSVPIPPSGNVIFYDSTPDAYLDTSEQAQLINNPPLQAKYMCTWGNRIFCADLGNAGPSDFIYSGLEQILRGLPPECFPPNNRIHADAGADALAGIGATENGVVAFSQTNRMYMLRGAVEDITTLVPVNFTDFFQELPWQVGCLSHRTIVTTPIGLIWWAGDKTVQLFDGTSAPKEISRAVLPTLRLATAGSEQNAVGCQFNWQDRDWYALLLPINGSTTPNYCFFFSLDKINDAIEIFPCSIPMGFIGTITTSSLQRMLCMTQGGTINQLIVTSETQNGLIVNPTPPTAGTLAAFWQSGYWGNDEAQRSKMWKSAFLILDPLSTYSASNPAAANWTASAYFVGDINDERTFQSPEIFAKNVNGQRISLSRKANRCSILINFPSIDADATMLELTVASVPTADRM